jgi:putative DNA primase/helicase
VQIPEKQRDLKLLEKLLQELPGILNWAIKGCLEWQKNGLAAPRIVLDATAEYRDEEDELGDFIAERCIPGGQVNRKQLYDAYHEWAEAGGTKMPMKHKAFAKRIRVRPGISEGKSGKNRYWNGISLPCAGTNTTPTAPSRAGANTPFWDT